MPDDSPASPRPTTGPADRPGVIRWGILGTGAVATAFADGLQFLDDAALVAVGSRTAEAARSFASRYPPARAHGSHADLLDDPDVDVVYVATPNEAHLDNSLAVLEAGKALLCEKPFALDAEEGRAIVAAATAAGRFCMEGMWMRCSPALQEVLRRCRAGELGELRLLSAQLGFPNEVDPTSRFFAPPGGGALADLGVYPVSLAHALFGPPREITARAVIGDTGVDEQMVAILDHGQGRQSVLTASIRTQLANAATISGTLGITRIDEPLVFPERFRTTLVTPRRGSAAPRNPRVARLRNHPAGRALATARNRVRSRAVTVRGPGSGYTAEAAEVGRCLRAGLTESPLMPLSETIEILNTMDTIRAAFAGRD